MGRPLNFGLTDAISRIGGWSKPEIPALLDGIQGVVIYGDVSKSVASEVFEARGSSGTVTAGFVGMQVFSNAPGGIVIEELDARMNGTGGTPALGMNIVQSDGGAGALTKLDVGGIPTTATVKQITNTALPFSALLIWTPTVITGGGALLYSIQNRTRMWIPPGSYFQSFPVAFASISDCQMHITWRELSDVQGSP